MLSLMVMRHGKSDWDADAPDDHARPLNARGVASAERMGVVLRDLGLEPDLVISSTAERAKATAELARLAGGWDTRLILAEELYGAGVQEAIDVVAHLGEHHRRLMIVGHQPTWSMLVQHLTGARCEMRTAAIAEVEFQTDTWTSVAHTSGTLVHLLQSRPFLS